MTEERKSSKPGRHFVSLDDVTREWLQSRLETIEKLTEKDVLTICGQIVHGVDVRTRMAIEGLQDRKEILLVLLHTPGGRVYDKFVGT